MRLLNAFVMAILALALVGCSSACRTASTTVRYEPMAGPPANLQPGDITFTHVNSEWCQGSTFVGHYKDGCTSR